MGHEQLLLILLCLKSFCGLSPTSDLSNLFLLAYKLFPLFILGKLSSISEFRTTIHGLTLQSDSHTSARLLLSPRLFFLVRPNDTHFIRNLFPHPFLTITSICSYFTLYICHYNIIILIFQKTNVCIIIKLILLKFK